LVVITILAWGFWGLFAKIGVSAIGKYQYLFFVNLLMVSVIYGYLFFTRNVDLTLRKEIIYPVLGGICVGVSSILFYHIVERTKISWAVPLTSLYPAVTVILAVLILKEKLTLVQGLGIIFALIAGVLLSI
jgi:transporter family protein